MPAVTAAELATVPLFSSLDPDLLHKFAHRFEVDIVPAGRAIAREGASGYAFYVLRDGTATVSQQGVEVNRLVPGDFFGEMSILGDGHRTATVTADVECTVWTLFGASFRELEIDSPEAAEAITRAVNERVHTTG